MAVHQGQLTIGVKQSSQSAPLTTGEKVTKLGLPLQTIILATVEEMMRLGVTLQVETRVLGESKSAKLGYPIQSLSFSYATLNPKVSVFIQAIVNVLGMHLVSTGYFQDYLSTFARFFGVNAKQDAGELYLNKNDFSQLTPLPDNSAEALLTALLIRVMNYESSPLISKVVIELWKTEFINLNNKKTVNSILLVKLNVLATYVTNANPNISNQINNASSAITPNNITG